MTKKTPNDYLLSILIYLVLFFAAAVGTSRLLLQGELVTVPNLVGRTLNEARTESARRKTSLTVQGYQFDGRYERGRVVAQDPPPQSRIKSHRTVKVTLSEGSEKVAVPKLEGRSLEWAAQSLKNAKLLRGRVSQIHSAQYAAGRIIAQYPPPEATVGRSSAVNFLVSQGAWEDRFIMPDLIEKDANFVLRQLRALDFKVAEIHPSFYPGLEPGIIIKQFPVHGYKVQKRNQVALEVSK
ncbi:MAG: PASTA domain-containing protein [Candidatus Aminicenantes bacterium]|nr:PASTA domain-containing protein [Candidatus Aminicenantes bacterium]